MFRSLAAALAALAVLAGPVTAFAQEKITVFAAASLKEVMDKASPIFKEKTGTEVTASLASSSVLARQIEAGAPADIFISADEEWMDWVAERDLIKPESRRLVAANDLVILSSDESLKDADPEAVLGEGRFSMGDPAHVPAGRYGKAALESLGLWEKVEKNAALGENVRVALELASRGEVRAAIVYGSDHSAAPDLVNIYTFPKDSHPPIVYPAALTASTSSEAATAFLDFLGSEEGRKIFAEQGFVAPPAE